MLHDCISWPSAAHSRLSEIVNRVVGRALIETASQARPLEHQEATDVWWQLRQGKVSADAALSQEMESLALNVRNLSAQLNQQAKELQQEHANAIELQSTLDNYEASLRLRMYSL